MQKLAALIIMCLLACVLCTSGCIKTTPTNNTFGEKEISLDALKVINTTTGNYSYEGTNYYYLEGYIKNNDPIDAINVQMTSKFYSANGSVLATNKTVFLNPKIIPAHSESYFYFEIMEPEEMIVNYKIEVISAKAEY